MAALAVGDGEEDGESDVVVRWISSECPFAVLWCESW